MVKGLPERPWALSFPRCHSGPPGAGGVAPKDRGQQLKGPGLEFRRCEYAKSWCVRSPPCALGGRHDPRSTSKPHSSAIGLRGELGSNESAAGGGRIPCTCEPVRQRKNALYVSRGSVRRFYLPSLGFGRELQPARANSQGGWFLFSLSEARTAGPLSSLYGELFEATG